MRRGRKRTPGLCDARTRARALCALRPARAGGSCHLCQPAYHSTRAVSCVHAFAWTRTQGPPAAAASSVMTMALSRMMMRARRRRPRSLPPRLHRCVTPLLHHRVCSATRVARERQHDTECGLQTSACLLCCCALTAAPRLHQRAELPQVSMLAALLRASTSARARALRGARSALRGVRGIGAKSRESCTRCLRTAAATAAAGAGAGVCRRACASSQHVCGVMHCAHSGVSACVRLNDALDSVACPHA
jgi:hypothetical protein